MNTYTPGDMVRVWHINPRIGGSGRYAPAIVVRTCKVYTSVGAEDGFELLVETHTGTVTHFASVRMVHPY